MFYPKPVYFAEAKLQEVGRLNVLKKVPDITLKRINNEVPYICGFVRRLKIIAYERIAGV